MFVGFFKSEVELKLGYTNDLKIDLKSYDWLYLFFILDRNN